MSRARDYFLTGPRLGFSRWTPEDLRLALALWGDPEVARLIGGPSSPEQIEEKLRQEIAWQAAQNIQYWPIFLLATDQHVGCAGLRPYQAAGPVHELGFHLRRAFWGNGLAEEAARAVIAFAFQTLNVASLFAGHHPENAASRHILQKLGFRYTHDDLYPPTGLLHPCYSLTAPSSADSEVGYPRTMPY
ncbi:MAG TPA: GNAT family N-acetyltransferase [Candidatus Acidoferrales bacterium]|nr:GNAT family N-acetyltransferase [Candidatus Acidoferrales bacterium]